MENFSDNLERRARSLVQDSDTGTWDLSIQSMLEREVALTIDHIENLHTVHKKLSESMLQQECYIDSELMQMEERTPRYSPYRFPEREKLQARLSEVAKERRDLETAHQEKLRQLHSQLLALLNRHSQLNF